MNDISLQRNINFKNEGKEKNDYELFSDYASHVSYKNIM